MLPLDTKMRWWKTPRLILYSAIICGTEGVLMQCRWANCFLCFVLDDQKGKVFKNNHKLLSRKMVISINLILCLFVAFRCQYIIISTFVYDSNMACQNHLANGSFETFSIPAVTIFIW